eukprot:SAG31_NODE_40585_length_280_cov_0.574586_1_plen_54_part_01
MLRFAQLAYRFALANAQGGPRRPAQSAQQPAQNCLVVSYCFRAPTNYNSSGDDD